MAAVLDGRRLAAEIERRLQALISETVAVTGRPPGLAVLRVGDDPASGVYVANKEKACERVGIRNLGAHLSARASAGEVQAVIERLNADPEVDGILLQLPLPPGLPEGPLLAAIDPEKDADGLHTLNLGRLVKGEPGPRSCTPAGVMALLRQAGVPLEGSRAVVVDVGIHQRPPDPNAGPMAKAKLCGDVKFEEVEPIAGAISPVPGGVGPMTVAMLLLNTVVGWCHAHGQPHGLDDLLG